ncbi:MAG: 5'-methylthioadenosine/S-adenosylhomocysteine nucleosidase [Bryobacterales bacterium]|nr:5'-methylthioadenosine/S-adenosylhomocysteine nucleosidase [Bryobacterales bacterium]
MALWLVATMAATPQLASQTAQEFAAPVDILVQGAELSELGPLLAALDGKREVRIGTWYYWVGVIGEKRVVVSLTEVGPMNASASTALAIERWKPRAIINQGTSGAHDPRLKIRDIVLGVKNVEFNAYNTLPGKEGEGISLGRITPKTTKMRIGSAENRVAFTYFPSHPQLVEQALHVPYKLGRVLPGVVGSGHQWNRELDRIRWLRKTYGSDVEDMESTYAAAVAYAFKIPFLSVRIVSDSEFHDPLFLRETGTDCAEFVLEFLRVVDLSKLSTVTHEPLPDSQLPATIDARP